MKITSLTTSSVQALYLQTLLGNSSSSEEDSALSTVQDTSDILDLSSVAQWANRSQASNPFQTDFENLGTLISSGDLAGAKSAFAAMQEKLQSQGKRGRDGMAEDFAAIGAALESGNTDTAKSAWQTMQTRMEAVAAERGQEGRNPMREDMNKLGKLLEAGDLSGAQSLFKTMQTRMERGAKSHNGGNDRKDLKSAFEAVGSALESGDLTSAQSAWEALKDELESMAPPKRDTSNANSGLRVTEMDALLISASMTTSFLKGVTGTSSHTDSNT